jgi:uncharacterized protein YbcI
MPGFAYRYRTDGGRPTVDRFLQSSPAPVSEGDMLTLENGHVRVGATGDGALLGAATGNGDGEAIEAITDADAVYAVADAFARALDATLDLTGSTGAQGVAEGPNGDLTVVVAGAAADETLVRISVGKHASDGWSPGKLNAELARAVVRVHREHAGRGPTKAQAFFRNEVVVVLMQDVMTKAERTLVDSGQPQAVLDMRYRLQIAMRDDLIEVVERLTGRRVAAFMSDNQVDPDMAAEVFVLDRPVPAERPPHAGPI